MAKTNKEQRNETKKMPNLGIYNFTFYVLRNDLKLLQALNNELPQSIEQIVSRREREFERRFNELNEKSRVALKRLLQILQESSQIKQGSMTLKTMAEDEEIIELLLQKLDTQTFPDRVNSFIRDMSLIYLVTKFESFLKRILRITYEKKPEILMSRKKTMTYEDLLKLSDYEAIKRQIIEKEMLRMFYQGIESIDRYFDKKFDLKLSQLANWKEFKERFYRRHILVHNSGVSNEQYRRKTACQGKNIRMEVSGEYLSDSIKLFEEIALKISEHFYSKYGKFK